MIIYSSTATRIFPFIGNTIVARYVNCLQYKEPFVPTEGHLEEAIKNKLKENFTKLPTKLSESIPAYNPNRQDPRNIVEYRVCPYFIDLEKSTRKEFKIKEHLKNTEFDIVYGVFSPTFIEREKKPNDIYFTILEHPVQNLYNLWSYYNFAIKKIFKKINSIDEYNKKNRWIYNFITKFPKQEDFIDFIIEHKQIYIENFGLNFKWAENVTNNRIYKNFDFIGVFDSQELTLKTLEYLENILKINILSSIDPRLFKTSSLAVTNFEELNLYRKDDMIKAFKDNIEYYKMQKDLVAKL